MLRSILPGFTRRTNHSVQQRSPRRLRPRLERLEDRVTPVVVNVTGTADHDFGFIRLREPAAPGEEILEIRLNSDLVFSDRRVNVEAINIATLGGDDTVRIDFTNGNPLRDVPLTFSAGDNDDALEFHLTRTHDDFSVVYQGGAGTNEVIAANLGIEMTLRDDLLQWQIGGITFAQATLEQVTRATLAGRGERAYFDASAFTGNASLIGTELGDELIGGLGDDHLFGIDGWDTLESGPGNDVVEPAKGEANGGPGDDRFVIHDRAVSTSIDGGEGSDSLLVLGTDEDDRFGIETHFSDSDRVVVSRGGARQVVAAIENVDFQGSSSGLGTGHDTLFVSFRFGNPLAAMNLEFRGGAGDDAMVFDGGGFGGSPIDSFSAVFHGGDGADRIEATVEGDVDLALTNSRLFRTNDAPPFILGAEVLLDSVDEAVLIGELFLRAGNNLLDASGFSAGRVTLRGGDGDDWLIGSPNNDILDGGAGDDRVEGGGGHDTYLETPGSFDQLIDTGGIDTVDFSQAEQGVSVNFLRNVGQVQTIDAAGNQLALSGFFERVIGSAFDDFFFFGWRAAGSSGVELDAGAGADRIDVKADAPPGQPFGLHLGDGADQLNLEFVSSQQQGNPAEFVGQIAAGAGADAVHLSGVLPRKLDLFADLSFGDDVMSWSWIQPPIIEFQRVHVRGGDGDDTIDGRSTQATQAFIKPVGDYLIELGFGNDVLNLDGAIRLEVSAGPDDDHVSAIMPRNADVAIDLGVGDDVLDLTGKIEAARLDVRAGAGDDAISAYIEATGVTAPSDFRFDLGAGADVLNLVGAIAPCDDQPGGPVTFHVAAGAGDDRIAGVVEAFGLIAVPDIAMSVDLNDGDDVLDLNLTTPDSFQLNVLGGAGADVVDLVGITTPADNHWNIFANLGAHDDVLSFHWQPADATTQVGSLSMNLTVVGGTGADVVDLVGVTTPDDNHWNIFANLGVGHDEFNFDANAAAARSTVLSLIVAAGPGNDLIDLVGAIAPNDSVWNVWINLGAGHDIANLSFLVAAPAPNRPQNAILNVTVNGGAGADEIETRIDAASMNDFHLRGRIRLLGGQGNDHLGLFVDDNIIGLMLSIDGGTGKNFSQTQGKVRVLRSRVGQ